MCTLLDTLDGRQLMKEHMMQVIMELNGMVDNKLQLAECTTSNAQDPRVEPHLSPHCRVLKVVSTLRV